jgi:two-component system, LytTR family, response regulator LytT
MTQPLRTFIVDDEAPARRELKYLLEQIPDILVVGEAANGTAALKGIRENRPHLVFLDIQMPGLNGLELAQVLAEMTMRPLLVFATAFNTFALQAFEVDAIDYICKPFTRDRVEKTVVKAAKIMTTAAGSEGAEILPSLDPCRRISLYRGEIIVPTAPEQIIYAHAEEGEVVVYTVSGRYHTRCTLGELEQKLVAVGFVRSHRSYLVNIAHVGEVIPWFNGGYRLVMDDTKKTRIPVSRYNVNDIKRHFDL